jgi:Predicted divalent heavy-metal cations transporter
MSEILISEKQVQSVMTKSSLPVGGYSVNPYVGCTHACKYCYASFMKRFTGHTEPWGTFLDVKNWEPIKDPHKFDGQRIVIGSVTDGYNPQEEHYRRTRRLLEELQGALAMSIGIAIQNIPEGAIISMPMRAAGNSRWKSFLIGSLSGVVEPVGGLLIILLASLFLPAMPYLLAFAAGAMLYVVVEELIPEASNGTHSNLSTIGFALGFVLMMVLDVVMG